jgi:hypothetical protein
MSVRIRATSVAAALILGSMLFGSALAVAGPREAIRVDGESVRPVTEPAEIGAWMNRLVGRFVIEGMINAGAGESNAEGDSAGVDCAFCKAVKGTADCIRIGTGPGVQCMLDAKWEDMYEVVQPITELPEPREPIPPPAGAYELPGGVSYLSPAMMLFGLDPGKGAIAHLVVNNKGLPEGGPGFVIGNRASFKTSCVNAASMLAAMKPPPKPPQPPDYEIAWQTCDRVVHIDASPDAKPLFMMIEININQDPFTLITLSLRRMPSDAVGSLR